MKEKNNEQIDIKKLLKNKIVLFGAGVCLCLYALFQIGIHIPSNQETSYNISVIESLDDRVSNLENSVSLNSDDIEKLNNSRVSQDSMNSQFELEIFKLKQQINIIEKRKK